jgi:nucleotide-binding universal stress UspA family protein
MPRLVELQQELYADIPHIKLDVVAQQSATTAIVKHATDLSVDLIVMGTQGHSALSAFFIGSVAENVVRHAPCSVLVARSPHPAHTLPRRMLAATDFSGAGAVGVTKARELAMALRARVTLVHVFVEPSPLSLGKRFLYQASDELLDSLRDELRNVAGAQLSGLVDVTHELLRGKQAASALCTHASEHDDDLIVVTAQGHSALKHMLIGSVSEKVVRHAPCSVLVLRPSS